MLQLNISLGGEKKFTHFNKPSCNLKNCSDKNDGESTTTEEHNSSKLEFQYQMSQMS